MEIREFIEPTDINWINVKNKPNQNKIKLILLRILLLLILVFLTTPTTIYQIIRDNPLLHISEKENEKQEIGSLQKMIYGFLSPILILVINRILLLLIYFLSKIKSTKGRMQ